MIESEAVPRFVRVHSSSACARGSTQTWTTNGKPSAIESYIKARAKQQGITLLDHRDPADVRGLQAEATAKLAPAMAAGRPRER